MKMFALTWCLLIYLSARCYAFDLQVNTTEDMVSKDWQSLDHEGRTARRLCSTSKVPKEVVSLQTGAYLFHLKTMNWEEARLFCRSKTMDLVAIESEAENAALAEYGNKLGFFTPYNGAWTSGCYHSPRSNFVWHSTGENITYSNWWTGYPKSTSTDAGYCIIFYPPDPRWWEVQTSLYLPVICEL